MAETDGIEMVGPVTIIRRSDPLVEIHHEQAQRSARTLAFSECAEFTLGLRRMAGPYDDTRSLDQLLTWLTDQIRVTNSEGGQ
jgi:hypothetical protein